MAVYLYGIVDAEAEVSVETVHGVGDPPAALRTVTADGLTAVVSDSPERLRAKRRDISAHHAVLAELGTRTTVVPMRFGIVAETEDEITRALQARADDYRATLRRLRGAVEFNVKVAQDESAALRQIIEDNAEVRRLNQITRDGGSREDSIALGELVTGELRARRHDTGERIAAHLAVPSRQAVTTPPTEGAFLNASFLVPREDSETFVAETRGLAEQYGGGYTFRVSGPLPPYSFV